MASSAGQSPGRTGYSTNAGRTHTGSRRSAYGAWRPQVTIRHDPTRATERTHQSGDASKRPVGSGPRVLRHCRPAGTDRYASLGSLTGLAGEELRTRTHRGRVDHRL